MGGALMSAPLREGLLFCVFSFLFGCFSSLFSAFFRAPFAAFCLLPDKEQEKKVPPRVIIGCFLHDILLSLFLSSFYMIFLFLANDGTFRVYSLAFCLLGFFLFSPISRTLAYPLVRVFSFFASLLAKPWRLFLRFLHHMSRKKGKRLDEKGKMM